MRNLKIGRIGAAVVIAAVAGSMVATAAFADRRDDHRWRGHERGWGRGYPAPYVYAQPVYVPPPVYYPPQPSPGVSLFVPLNLRIR
jgi:hypothetical protein